MTIVMKNYQKYLWLLCNLVKDREKDLRNCSLDAVLYLGVFYTLEVVIVKELLFLITGE